MKMSPKRNHQGEGGGIKPTPAIQRLWNYCVPEPNSGCWLWIGAVSKVGYGTIWENRRTRLAHRVAYEAIVGPIPPGMTLDHQCGVRCCVNPAHLRPASYRENVLRSDTPASRNLAKRECKHGHALSTDNLYVTPSGQRACRVCLRRADEKRRNRKRGIAL